MDQHLLNIFQVNVGTGRGDNYTSMLYRVLVRGTTAHQDSWEKSFVCKILPANQARREAFKSESLFKNEASKF